MAILIVEDDGDYRRLLRKRVAEKISSEHGIMEASNLSAAKDCLQRAKADLILLDSIFPYKEGGEEQEDGGRRFLSHLASLQERKDMAVVVISGQDTSSAVKLLLSHKIDDYVVKGTKWDLILARVEAAVSKLRLSKEVKELRQGFGASPPPSIVARSAAMKATLEKAKSVAATSTTVLLLGESGVGKEVLARRIHAESPRREGPFVAVNCAALVPELAESELFGHRGGSFTGAKEDRMGRIEMAAGGTLFLDEVGDIPLSLQVKLLRVLEERVFERVGESIQRPVNLRLLSATNRDLQQAIGEGSFREDFYFRLNVFSIEIPPLRERLEDIAPLAESISAAIAPTLGLERVRFEDETLRELSRRIWPGNVRELRNAIEYALVMSKGDALKVEHLPPCLAPVAGGGYGTGGGSAAGGGYGIGGGFAAGAVGHAQGAQGDHRCHDGPRDSGYLGPAGHAGHAGHAGWPRNHKEALAAFERCFIEDALDRNGGSVAATARDLSLAERTLRHRMGRLGIDPKKHRKG